MHASHVVVDGHDGYTFWRDADGELFDAGAAMAFANQRNAEMKPEHRSYQVFTLADPGYAAATAGAMNAKAASYAADARRYRDNPQLRADLGAADADYWARHHQSVADELRKLATAGAPIGASR